MLNAPAGKTDKELALELAAKGKSAAEIAKQMGKKYSTVYAWLNPEKCKKKASAKKGDIKPVSGWNADRHGCRSCMYRATGTLKSNGAGCDYAGITEHIRDCSVENCTKYIKGTPKSKKKQVKNNGKENE